MAFSGYQDLDRRFAEALQRMTADIPGITPFSGYRSREQQAQLFANAVKKYGSVQRARHWVAPPGRSQHQFRMAADLMYATPEAQRRAHAEAAKYGLVFPMSWEPKHIELIGARGQKRATAKSAIEWDPTKTPPKPGRLSEEYTGVPEQMKPKIVTKDGQTKKEEKSGFARASETWKDAYDEQAKQQDKGWDWIRAAMAYRPQVYPFPWPSRSSY